MPSLILTVAIPGRRHQADWGHPMAVVGGGGGALGV